MNFFNPGISYGASSQFEIIQAPSNVIRGSNFIVISHQPHGKGNTYENRQPKTWSDVVTLNREKLKQLASEHQIGVSPCYAFTAGRPGRETLSFVGVRDKEVWAFSMEGSSRTEHRLGREVSSDDARLPEYGRSVAGSTLVLAYEAFQAGIASAKIDLTAIVHSQNTVYAVSKMSPSSYAVAQIGTVETDE